MRLQAHQDTSLPTSLLYRVLVLLVYQQGSRIKESGRTKGTFAGKMKLMVDVVLVGRKQGTAASDPDAQAIAAAFSISFVLTVHSFRVPAKPLPIEADYPRQEYQARPCVYLPAPQWA